MSSAISAIVAARDSMGFHINNLSNAQTNSFRAEMSQITDNIYINKINPNTKV